jgi:hypothetical protein
MRSLRAPAVRQYFDAWLRFRRYQRLPESGGTNDQDNQTLMAFDAIESAFHLEPPATRDGRRRHRLAAAARRPTACGDPTALEPRDA